MVTCCEVTPLDLSSWSLKKIRITEQVMYWWNITVIYSRCIYIVHRVMHIYGICFKCSFIEHYHLSADTDRRLLLWHCSSSLLERSCCICCCQPIRTPRRARSVTLRKTWAQTEDESSSVNLSFLVISCVCFCALILCRCSACEWHGVWLSSSGLISAGWHFVLHSISYNQKVPQTIFGFFSIAR